MDIGGKQDIYKNYSSNENNIKTSSFFFSFLLLFVKKQNKTLFNY